MLRMRDGVIHWGRIRGHDPEVLNFVRLDNGGRAAVPWGLLDPAQERELRAHYGYIDESDDEILIKADRLVLVDGSEVIGLILSRTTDTILVKTSTAVVPVPKIRIGAASTTVLVPALDIYTREELYSQQLVMTPAGSPQGQFELAQYCERILDYGHAVEHYTLTQELDASYRTDDVAAALSIAVRKARRQNEIDELAEIERLRKRKKYDAAMLLVEAFPDRHPESPLLADLQKRRKRIERSILKDLQNKVTKSWHTWAGKLSRRMASSEFGFEEILAYIEDSLSDEITAKVFSDLQRITKTIELGDVRTLWDMRSGGRWHKASYGNGTWLLGDDQARKGVPEEAQEEAKTQKQGERDALEEKLKRFLRNQEMVKKSKTKAAKQEDFDAFWGGFSLQARTQWVLAYYVEFGGDMRVHEKPLFQNCRECAGKGVKEVIFSGGAVSGSAGAGAALVDCPTCHHVGLVRRLRYR
jgi:hypothetical protein